MSAYVMAQLKIHDTTSYDEYIKGWPGPCLELFRSLGGEFLAADYSTKTLEGDWPFTRTILLKFPDADSAGRWFHSDEYQAIAGHRRRGADSNIALVNGL